MKILMVSIWSSHFFNWAEQLRDSGHEIYWIDIFDSRTKVGKINFAHQITGWRYRINYPGRYRIKKRFPFLNNFLNIFNERKFEKVFEEKLKQIEPDVVHSFVLYLGGAPILKVMKKHPNLRWIYSSWGSDLYYYRKQEKQLRDIKKVLPCVDYMFADCLRDYKIAKEYGFQGKFLGVYPGRGGYELAGSALFKNEFERRNIILIKGYQGKHGKCLEVLKAVTQLKEELGPYQIKVFGAAPEVRELVLNSELKTWSNLDILGWLPHEKVLELLGKSILFIGNSTSDGIPNTLLEAVVMGAFPLQSNPGGATAELIVDGMNGFLIRNPEDTNEISVLIRNAVKDPSLLKKGAAYNTERIRPKLERNYVKEKVLEKYKLVENNLNH